MAGKAATAVGPVSKIKSAGRRRNSGRDGSGLKAASKSDAIRQVLAELGPEARPRDVIAHLTSAGVPVTAAQVSVIRKQFGKHSTRSAHGTRAGKHSGDSGIAVAHLIAAKRLADQVGLDAARRALEVLAGLAKA